MYLSSSLETQKNVSGTRWSPHHCGWTQGKIRIHLLPSPDFPSLLSLISTGAGGSRGDVTHTSFLQGPDAPLSPGWLGGPIDSYCGARGTKRHPRGSLDFIQMCKRSPPSCCWAGTLTYSRMAALILTHWSMDKSPRCPDGSHNL